MPQMIIDAVKVVMALVHDELWSICKILCIYGIKLDELITQKYLVPDTVLTKIQVELDSL